MEENKNEATLTTPETQAARPAERKTNKAVAVGVLVVIAIIVVAIVFMSSSNKLSSIANKWDIKLAEKETAASLIPRVNQGFVASASKASMMDGQIAMVIVGNYQSGMHRVIGWQEAFGNTQSQGSAKLRSLYADWSEDIQNLETYREEDAKKAK